MKKLRKIVDLIITPRASKMRPSVLILFCVVILTSCTIERRLYRDGFYVDSRGEPTKGKFIEHSNFAASDTHDLAHRDTVTIKAGGFEADTTSTVLCIKTDSNLSSKVIETTGNELIPRHDSISDKYQVDVKIPSKEDVYNYRRTALISTLLIVLGWLTLILAGAGGIGILGLVGLLLALLGTVFDVYILFKLRKLRLRFPELAGNPDENETELGRMKKARLQALWLAWGGLIVFSLLSFGLLNYILWAVALLVQWYSHNIPDK